jgi:hypothetical protein
VLLLASYGRLVKERSGTPLVRGCSMPEKVRYFQLESPNTRISHTYRNVSKTLGYVSLRRLAFCANLAVSIGSEGATYT